MTTETIALKRYNSLFDNQQYSAIGERIAVDLRVARDSLRVSDCMNEITNTALSLCNHSHYADAWLRLATFCGQNAISIPTIDAIYNYLLIYQQMGDTRADDFELTAKAILKAYSGLDDIKTAVAHANGVHGWHGRMAYDLLAAADYFIRAAVQLLSHEDEAYTHEKLRGGLNRITGALCEGIRHSPEPSRYNFKSIYFPDERDR